jgi:predicted nucleic acid-binding protein
MALHSEQRFQLSYWDAAIIEASRVLGCEVVLSEDLNDGQDYAGVRVHEPVPLTPSNSLGLVWG